MYNPLKIHRWDRIFFACLAGSIFILTLTITWISYTVSSKALLQTTSYYQQGLLTELNKKTMIQLDAIEQTSLSTTLNMDFLDYLSYNGDDDYTHNKKYNDTLQYLTNIANSVSNIFSIHLYIEHPVRSDRQRTVQFYDFSRLQKESWYPEVKTTDFAWIGEHTIDTFQGRMSVLSFARKIYSSSNEYKGLILINVKASAIRSLIQAGSGSANRMLFDSGGNLLVGVGQPIAADNVSAYVKNPISGAGSLRIDVKNHQRYLLAWSKMFNSDWTLTEITPWRKVTNGSLKLAELLLIIGLSTILIAIAISLSISRQLHKPLGILVKAMGKYAFDSSKVSLPDDYRNEFGYLFNSYRRQMERIDELYRTLEVQLRRQREAEVKALQANINPHFLYNTLDQINWMAMQEGQYKISNILELTGQMFRIGLSNGESLIPIADELRHVECYLRIQQLRWENGLDYEVRVPDRLTTCLIPKITLQPFVENAILHGFHGRSAGFILIEAFGFDRGITIRITDDGRGFQVNGPDNRKKVKGGYGIRNVRERIDALFGSLYGVTIESTLSKGTVVSVSIPLLAQPTASS
ncbi:two-component system, sensor histidine kinase YesM [Paenibacillus sp. UNC496MF]|uniref:sensor histidine kinase n=1 Tax=Paenibacillus sp. UNC496MF TaxID=1502753 RepID=UPI0008E6B942|nr:sensor histidine kinase [Paenibacillus sp. UNC496MF]SFJ54664.1 two-component system, sensor histidine kinase YesM [Paenibacillus sp. UNC496MF]